MDKLKPESYIVRVEKDGLLTYANSDAAFEITNIPPKAAEVSVSIDVNKSIDIGLIPADAKEIATGPSHGTLTNINIASGRVTYTSNKDQAGEDSFSFKLISGACRCYV